MRAVYVSARKASLVGRVNLPVACMFLFVRTRDGRESDELVYGQNGRATPAGRY